MTSYRSAGIVIPRTTWDQINVGRPVAEADLEPGDLVFPDAGHVQLFLGRDASGDPWIVEAPHTGAQVRVTKLWGFMAARRIVGIAG